VGRGGGATMATPEERRAVYGLIEETERRAEDKDELAKEEEVFIQTWLPSNLNQISDLGYIETELDKLKRGEELGYERLVAHSAVTQKKGSSAEEGEDDADDDGDHTDDEQDEDVKEKRTSRRKGQKQQDKVDAKRDGDAGDDDDDEDEEDGSDDDESKEVRDGHIPEGMSKAEWKKKVKTEKAEKRKEKVPKHLKKKFRKTAANR